MSLASVVHLKVQPRTLLFVCLFKGGPTVREGRGTEDGGDFDETAVWGGLAIDAARALYTT